jgi:putative ABC transport system substrate-binding protein
MQRTGRRRFLLGAGALAAAPLARAGTRMPVLALLYPNPTITTDGDFREGAVRIMKRLGWLPGKDLEVRHYSGEGREERMPALAERAVREGADTVWVAGPEAALAAARATKDIPVAFYGVAFPVEHGLVDSLARPGRNVTGLTSLAGSEWSKCIRAMLEIAPGIRRIGYISVTTIRKTVAGGDVHIRDARADPLVAGTAMEILRHPVARPEDLDGALQSIAAAHPDALMCDFTAMTFRERLRIIDFANGNGLPSMFGAWPFVRDGGLIAYAADRVWMVVHSFTFVDRILRGARPADLPVEQPTRFELMINLRTARRLGLTVPDSLLLRADKVVE